jgi:hypothetical protein
MGAGFTVMRVPWEIVCGADSNKSPRSVYCLRDEDLLGRRDCPSLFTVE